MNAASPRSPHDCILVVDSQRNRRAITGLLLKAEGYTVHEAATSEEALALLSAQEVDVMVTNLILKPLDGFALLDNALRVKPTLAVIVFTASTVPENAVRALRMGAWDYLVVGRTSAEMLVHRVAHALKHNRAFQQRQREAVIDRITEELFDRVQALTSEPLAIEALWAGGPDRSLGLHVVTQEAQASRAPRQVSHVLMQLKLGTDRHLFEGPVTPWPEAQVAQHVGRAVARGWAIPFWFPSPQQPDDRCPHWWEREKAVRCEDCGKLFLPDSPPPPGSRCAPCHQEQESLARLRRNPCPEGSPGMYWVLHHGEAPLGSGDLLVGFLPLPKGDIAQALARPGECLEPLPDLTLTGSESTRLRTLIQQRLETLLTDHPPLDEARSGLHPERTLFGKSYGFDPRNTRHLRILQLHNLYRGLDAYPGKVRLSLITDRGLGPRERHVLRVIKEHRDSERTPLQELFRHRPALGTPRDIRELLQTLEKRGCVFLRKERVHLTPKGRLFMLPQE